MSGIIPLDQFLDWFLANLNAIENQGSDDDVSILNRVFHLYAEYTSDYIDAAEFLNALRTDALVLRELQTYRIAVA